MPDLTENWQHGDVNAFETLYRQYEKLVFRRAYLIIGSKEAAEDADISLAGPKKAFLLQGEDRIGALYDFHLKLSNAGINIYACNGVVDGTGRFGYVIWVAPADYEEASKVLKSSDWRTIQVSRRT